MGGSSALRIRAPDRSDSKVAANDTQAHDGTAHSCNLRRLDMRVRAPIPEVVIGAPCDDLDETTSVLATRPT